VRGELLVFGHGGRITMGDWCYVGEQTRIWSSCSISIGNRVLISHLVTIMDNLTHPEDPAARHAQFRAIVETGFPTDDDLGERPVTIGDDVLIGGHSLVLRGVTIGRGAIVGAGSVVTKDVAPMTIVAGNPARYVRDVVEADRGAR
jgi:acetyltransferase-like isoleucine patch superfamily enzyme